MVATAASKTFGLSSLRISNIMIPNTELRERFIRRLDAHGMDVFNSLAMCAATAAYTTSSQWLDDLISYLQANINLLSKFINTELPLLRFMPPEAGYLAWVDCRKLHLSDDELEQKLINAGDCTKYGNCILDQDGSGFIRLNLGCPQETLQLALEHLKLALTQYTQKAISND